jgi:NADH-ubiquinone oxidoreductase chain 4
MEREPSIFYFKKMLTLLLIIPLLGSLLLLPMQESNKNQMRTIALGTSLINLVLSIVL